MDPIEASNTWRWYGYENSWIVLDGIAVQSTTGGGHWGGGMFIHAYDMARFGYLTLRQGSYLRNALIRSLPSILFVVIAIGGPSIGLVRANMLGALLVGSAVLLYLLVMVVPASARALVPMAQRFRQYPLLLAPTSLLDAAAVTMPVFFISAAYGLESTGHYTQIQRLLGAPMILAGVVIVFVAPLGGYWLARRATSPIAHIISTAARLYELFPNLGRMKERLGGRMSGGEQQMLTIARTLMGNPSCVLLDMDDINEHIEAAADERSIRAFAVKPRAFGAPLFGVGA